MTQRGPGSYSSFDTCRGPAYLTDIANSVITKEQLITKVEVKEKPTIIDRFVMGAGAGGGSGVRNSEPGPQATPRRFIAGDHAGLRASRAR